MSDDAFVIDEAVVDRLIADIDRRLSAQIDEILHAPAFQTLEAAWRSLHYLVFHVDFRENVRVAIVSASKEALRSDLEGRSIRDSGLFDLAGPFRGYCGGMPPPWQPASVIAASYDFDTRAEQDIALLERIACVAASLHTPFLANASGAIELSAEDDAHPRWSALRDREESRFLALSTTRFLLRVPYVRSSARSGPFEHEEDVIGRPDRYVWGPSSVALAARMADAFARYRLCANIIGPHAGGAVPDVPAHWNADGGDERAIGPIDVHVSERREWELSEQGFISLVVPRTSAAPCFMSAMSVRRAPWLGGSTAELRRAHMDHAIAAGLPYTLIMARLPLYLRTLARERVGSWADAQTIERGLSAWLAGYVTMEEMPPPALRSRRPFRSASVRVEEAGPREHAFELRVEPHFLYMGERFTMVLTGTLERW